MKLILVTVVLSILGLASADVPKPQITIGISNAGLGNFEDGRLGGLKPGIKWQTEGSAPEFDWEAGVDVALEDLHTLPYSYWAKVKRKVKGFVLSAYGSSESNNLETIHVDLRADGPSTLLQVTGTASGSSYSIGKLNLRQAIGLPFGKLSVNPRYNVGSKKADVGVSFAMGSASVSMDSATKKVTLAQVVGGPDSNLLIIPSISMKTGQVEVAWQRKFESFGTVTTTVKPSESINVKWTQGSYEANVYAPIDGSKSNKVDVSIKKRVDL